MSAQNTTLKDIADILGVSTTTVHRALTGKTGVGDKMRDNICQLAANMGYSTNLAAAALKRKAIRIGVLIPDFAPENNYYYATLWSGVHDFMAQVGNQNVSLAEYYYSLIPGHHGRKLKEIYEHSAGELDGLITLGVDDSQSAYFIEKLKKAGIPIVILGADLYPDFRLCCVKADDEMAGSLAAELLTAFLPPDFQGSVLLTGNPVGISGMIDQYRNHNGFRQYLQNTSGSFSLFTAYCADVEDLPKLTSPYLSSPGRYPYAIYASSARHTIRICQILKERQLSGAIRVIGNDKFPASIRAIRDGILTASIDKKISQQSYCAAQILFDFLTRNKYPERDLIQIRPDILMKSNLEDGC